MPQANKSLQRQNRDGRLECKSYLPPLNSIVMPLVLGGGVTGSQRIGVLAEGIHEPTKFEMDKERKAKE
jgi:hypothetical protein